jgi:hypothetical protein
MWLGSGKDYLVNPSAPLHERWRTWGWLRSRLRGRLFSFLEKTARTDDGRRIISDAVTARLDWHPGALLDGAETTTPYAELGGGSSPPQPSDRSDVIIITARFRSGSTMLWNLFRQAGGFTAYYEPLHERRWFDPGVRQDRIDATHRNVEEYWREYDGLEVLGQYYDEDWTHRNLLMDENFWAPDLKQYVDILIDRAPARPVLQFNRIDFRLPWFRRHYPNATFLHIFRHPRDQWCSTLMEDITRYTKNMAMADFKSDRFYLRPWGLDLKYHFPFLDEKRIQHPYQLYYFIWKLSFMFGRKYCDESLQFEKLVEEPDSRIPELFHTLGAHSVDLESVKKVMSIPPLGRWRAYADEEWFQEHESHCDSIIADFLTTQQNPASSAVGAAREQSHWDR